MASNLTNIPYNEEERKFIRKNTDKMTSGQIAEHLNKLYCDYNHGVRTADGVRTFRYNMLSEYVRVEVEFSRNLKDRICDAHLDPVDVSMACESGIRQALDKILKHKEPRTQSQAQAPKSSQAQAQAQAQSQSQAQKPPASKTLV